MHCQTVAPMKFLAKCLLGSRTTFTMAVALVAAGVFFLATDSTVRAQPKDAPDLVGGVDWFNTDKPIKLEDLRGRIVLLDFWTLC